jgi:hypothetical protein
VANSEHVAFNHSRDATNCVALPVVFLVEDRTWAMRERTSLINGSIFSKAALRA